MKEEMTYVFDIKCCGLSSNIIESIIESYLGYTYKYSYKSTKLRISSYTNLDKNELTSYIVDMQTEIKRLGLLCRDLRTLKVIA